MNRFLFIVFLIMSEEVFAQSGKPVAMYDFVKIKEGRIQETLYYYENNWKIYRDIAVKKNFITGYRIVACQPDSALDFDLILITEYADSSHFARSEEYFGPIIKEVRPNGPILLNEWKPDAFRSILYSRRVETVISSD
ncbi:MAG TPA: hypothetical protein PLV75_04045 [Saprospiraceae bacterium]|nr:hypothetical protein [Saprospiraceae bacterium]HQW25101.1 hypothetical protein [Saprospiraceae bacterium]